MKQLSEIIKEMKEDMEKADHNGARIPGELLRKYLPLLEAIEANTSGEGDGWVSVEDRLPENGEHVLCWKESMIPKAFYSDTGSYGFFKDGIWGDVESDDWNVTHWRPLPAPPNSEQNPERELKEDKK